MESLYDLISTHAAQGPDMIAMRTAEQALTYRQLKQKVDDLATAMLASGIIKGDRVLAYSGPSIECYLTLLASMRVGAQWGGLNPRYTFIEIDHVLRQLQPKLLFCAHRIGKHSTQHILSDVQKAVANDTEMVYLDEANNGHSLTLFNDFLLRGNAVEAEMLNHIPLDVSTDPAIIIYTSGTTGTPKGAVLSQYSFLRHAQKQVQYWGVDRARLLNAYPINHLSGIVSTVTPLVSGGMVVLMNRFDPTAVPGLIEEHHLNIWAGVPTMYSMVLERSELERFDLSSLKTITWSGGSVSASLATELAKLNIPMTTMYAMTESGGLVSAVPRGFDAYALSQTLGKVEDDCELRLVDTDGLPVPQGKSGEIELRAPFLFLGYLQSDGTINPARTEDGWFPTGDLGAFDAEGNLKLVGRTKDFFKSGGFNIYPKEIELTLDSHPAIRFSAVVAVKDDHFGEIGLAYLQPAEGANIDLSSVAAHCKERLASFKIPKHFCVMNILPTLANGKIDKVSLRNQADLDAKAKLRT